MSDLPEAESADDLYEPNAKARRNQRTLYLAVAALIAVIGAFYVYSQFGKPPAAKVDETRKRVMATASIAKNPDPPEVVNGDLSRHIAQLQASNADLAGPEPSVQGRGSARGGGPAGGPQQCDAHHSGAAG